MTPEQVELLLRMFQALIEEQAKQAAIQNELLIFLQNGR